MEPTGAGNERDGVSALHQALVDHLISGGCIRRPQIEAASRAVPRHQFHPEVALEQVYHDEAVPTKRLGDQMVSSSSQPAVMAVMLEQLQLKPGHRVLEIGAGTGYNAALLAHLVGETGQVVSVDIDEDIAAKARAHLAAAGSERVLVVCGDGCAGRAVRPPSLPAGEDRASSRPSACASAAKDRRARSSGWPARPAQRLLLIGVPAPDLRKSERHKRSESVSMKEGTRWVGIPS